MLARWRKVQLLVGLSTCIKFWPGSSKGNSVAPRASPRSNGLLPPGARDDKPPRAEQVASLRAELKASQEYAQICEDEGVELRRQVHSPPIPSSPTGWQRGLDGAGGRWGSACEGVTRRCGERTWIGHVALLR